MIPLYQIHKEVSAYYNLDLDYIFQDHREKPVVEKRQIFHYISRILNPDMSLTSIGKYGQKRGHATVMHSIRVISDLIEVDREVRKVVNEILIQCKKHQIKEVGYSDFIPFKYELSGEILQCKSALELEAVLRRRNIIIV